MPTLLVIDDDRAIRHMLEAAFEGSPISVVTAKSVAEGLAHFRQEVDVVLLEMHFLDVSGLDVAREFQALDSKVPLIFMTAGGTSDTAIKAMKVGAYDYVPKPLDLPQLRKLVQRALEIRRWMKVPVELSCQVIPEAGQDRFIGRSAEMQEVFKSIGRVASRNITVLILGESGTGKELVAQSIYQHSDRAHKQFLPINCAAIPDNLLESELFGHEKGSFTSAVDRRIGKFEQVSGGTVFLDEVGNMSPLVQSKLLRFLQEQRFERVGGTKTIQTDVRIVAAANRDLKQLSAEGTFREDLYYRLAGYTIRLPPLRDRGQDIGMLLQHCLRRIGNELGKRVLGISPAALELLTNYAWPGNVRELEAAVRHSLLQSSGSVILPEFLPDSVRLNPCELLLADDCHSIGRLLDEQLQIPSRTQYADAVDLLERYLLTRVLQHTKGNQSQAANLLGVTRVYIRNKIQSLQNASRYTVTIDHEPRDQLAARRRARRPLCSPNDGLPFAVMTP